LTLFVTILNYPGETLGWTKVSIPFGSCTMKYNPKVNEDIAALSGFNSIHPYQPEELVQGALELDVRIRTGSVRNQRDV